MRIDRLLVGARLATMRGDGLGWIDDGALAIAGERIAWCGPMAEMPAFAEVGERIELHGALLTPGLIDCHTHLVFAGDRAREFDMRLKGSTYEDIARAGGGILSTVRETRAADEEALFRVSWARAAQLMAEGVTTLEIKSGYGLDLATERKMLRVARLIGASGGVDVRTTFLGAHALPPEYADDADGYIDCVRREMLPRLHAERLVDAVDAFCEGIGFTWEQTRRVFEAARQLGLPVKLHAEQLSDCNGAALAAAFGALSADHLEYVSAAGVAALAEKKVVAVMLPAAFYFLRERQVPPIEAFRQHGVALAVATDLNPGTAPVVSLLAAMHMAATLFRMTTEEVLRGVTVHAAQALGLTDRGTLAAGQRADLAAWAVHAPAELCYWLGGVKPVRVWHGGRERCAVV